MDKTSPVSPRTGVYIPPNKRGSFNTKNDVSAPVEPVDMAAIRKANEGVKLSRQVTQRKENIPNRNGNVNGIRKLQISNRSPKNCCVDEEGAPAESQDFTLEDFKNLKVEYYDSHCHIDMIHRNLRAPNDQGLAEWREKFEKSFNSNFAGCIPNFIEPDLFVSDETTVKTYDLAWIKKQMENKTLYAGSTFGCHPHQVKTWGRNETFWETLEELIADKRFRCIAVGECGIDLHRCESTLEDQIYAFRRQIQLAFKYGLTLVIHCRKGAKGDSEARCLEVLSQELNAPGQHKYLPIHRHCYTENWENAKKWIKVCPNIVFGYTPAALRFQGAQLDCIRMLPLDRIVLETDAPYFTPAVFRNILPKNTNMPGTAAATAFHIAKCKQIPVEEVLRAASCNTKRIYSLSHDL